VIRVLVVDDHPVVREGVAAILGDDPELQVVGSVATGEDALREAQTLHPDVVLMDARLPGMGGLEACSRLTKLCPRIGVVIMTTAPHEATAWRVFELGARGFVLKESDPSVYRDATHAAAAGERYADPHIAPKLDALSSGRRAKGPFGLTIQEMRVVELLPLGLTNAEIGKRLGVSEDTVKTHLRNAMRKLSAKDRAEAASIAIREGLA
jgi:DNA-binding NarL/FixJ family response regulator